MGDKTKPAYYTVDFVTALPLISCRERLEHEVVFKRRTIGEQLAPLEQQTTLRENGAFVVERTFPGAMHPIRLAEAWITTRPAGEPGCMARSRTTPIIRCWSRE